MPIAAREKRKVQISVNRIYNANCMGGMRYIPDKSVDMILCDPPYGTTACKWDSPLPLNDYLFYKGKMMEEEEFFLTCYKDGVSIIDAEEIWKRRKPGLWTHYLRIIRDDGAIVIFGSEPFATTVRASNIDMYKYDWIWQKNTVDGFFNAQQRPLKTIENIMVFSKKQARAKGDNMRYYPQGLIRVDKVNKESRKDTDEQHGYFRESLNDTTYIQEYTNYPTEMLSYERDKDSWHPTQKPVALLEYLIKTYTNEGELVLDNCMGSGSTAVACINTNRNFIGFELDKDIYLKSVERIERVKHGR